jgi:magnesium transporter
VQFHFEDIGEHADRVRQKIIEFEQTIQMSSDWISHGLMDSMVDAFAPMIQKIDREVEGVDSLITNLNSHLESVVPQSEITIVAGSSDAIEEKAEELEKSEKPAPPTSRVQFKLPLRLRRRSKEKAVVPEPPTKLATFRTLLRMANTRRLVTSLGRLLATKSEVIGQLRKRLQGTNGNAVDWDEGDMAGGQEVGIYLGDVQGALFDGFWGVVLIGWRRSYFDHATVSEPLRAYT